MSLRLIDRSAAPRFGVKGPGAAAWLQAEGVALPQLPNQWVAFGDGLVARLGLTEYLVECHVATHARLSAKPRGERVYPVLNQSLCVEISGAEIDALVRQICSVQFTALDPKARSVVLTSVIGISVIALPEFDKSGGKIRIWADNTFGRYLWQTLAQLCRELDGAFAPVA